MDKQDPPPPPHRKRGQRKPLTAEQQELAALYVPMARSLAKPYKEAWPNEWEAFDSAAMMALVEAAESFDPGRYVRFSTFARIRIVGALLDIQRQIVKTERQVDGTHSSHTGGDMTNLEGIGEILNATSEPEVGAELESCDAVEAWLCKLPAQHASACREIYLNGCNQAEAAERLGCSQSRMSMIHREAIAMLNGTWWRPGR
jgi:RNA polymerase sigma factor (sigma-70 family)